MQPQAQRLSRVVSIRSSGSERVWACGGVEPIREFVNELVLGAVDVCRVWSPSQGFTW